MKFWDLISIEEYVICSSIPEPCPEVQQLIIAAIRAASCGGHRY